MPKKKQITPKQRPIRSTWSPLSRTGSLLSQGSSSSTPSRSERSSSVSTTSRTSKSPSIQTLYKRYPNLTNSLSCEHWQGCRCEGPCQPETCICLLDKVPCRQSCGCDPLCEHLFPPCTCKTKGSRCGASCPCFLAKHRCSSLCACPTNTCDKELKLPEIEIKISTIPSAGYGIFAREDIPKKRLIRTLEGDVEPNLEQPDFSVFQIAKGHSLRCRKEGAYYTNELPHKDANAEFGYLESPRRREIILRAKRDIKAGEEICAQYCDPKEPPTHHIHNPQCGSYVLINGEGEDEPWVGKVISITRKEKDLTVQWLLRKKDIKWIEPPSLRKSVKLDQGELIMTKAWRDIVPFTALIQVVCVLEERPEEEMNSNLWWWTRTYDEKNKRMI